jgi:Rrf2 family protein
MISKKTINAIEVCVFLAGQRHAGYVTTTEMSPKLGLSISHLENLLKPLKAHRLVSAIKGPGGGYMIQRDISLISIWDIVSVFERTFYTTNSSEVSLPAELLDDKTPPASYELGLEQIAKATLSNFSLADFVDESRDEESRSFVQTIGRFKFKPMAAPLMPKAPNSVFQLSMMLA